MADALKCIVVTPERTVVDEAADFIAVPLFDGELGVLPGRAPLIGRLGFGELRTQQAGKTNRYYVDGGFVQVRGEAVTVLTPRALKVEDINVAQVEKQLEEAKQAPAASGTRAAEVQARARMQLKLAKKTASPF